MIESMVYIADARMPTENAYGWQITKMCGAFASLGVRVELWTPRRKQHEERAATLGLFEYYGVEPTFEWRQLRTIDAVRAEPFLPPMLSRPLIQAGAATWELEMVLRARATRPSLTYTRDLAVAVWCSLLGLPSVYEMHAFPGRRASRWLGRVASRREPRSLVALTPFLKERFIGLGFSEQRVIVEGDAVDQADHADLPSRDVARRQLGLPADRQIVGYAGRFETMGKQKGLSSLVEAMSFIRADGLLEPLLVCVGGPMAAVPDYLAAAGRVGVAPERLRFVDRVPNSDVPLWMRAFDVAVLPYPNDPHMALAASPLKLFEYMAAETPIVATDLPSIRLVLEDGRNAALVPPGSPEALGSAIGRLLAQPNEAAALALAAKNDVAEATWDARAARILAAGSRP